MSARVGVCTRCGARWLLDVVCRDRGEQPKCPECRARVEEIARTVQTLAGIMRVGP